jgi:hypothetical protein
MPYTVYNLGHRFFHKEHFARNWHMERICELRSTVFQCVHTCLLLKVSFLWPRNRIGIKSQFL